MIDPVQHLRGRFQYQYGAVYELRTLPSFRGQNGHKRSPIVLTESGNKLRSRIYSVKPETDLRGGCLTVDFFPMTNLDDTDNQTHIGDRIDDPIRSLADAIFIIVARKFFTTRRKRIGRKILNTLDDAETVFFGG